MAGVTDADIAALADDALPPHRRAQVEAAVAACPDLARKLAVQLRARATIRAAAALIEAPGGVRNPLGPAARSTDMPSFTATADRRTATAPWALVARGLGALATLAVGAVHLQQYFELYSSVPTIGTLFVLNFAGATVIGLALLAPIERVVGLAAPLAALAGIGLAATSFVFLWISERTPLFGFQEPGYDPTAIAASRAAEIAAVVLLGGYLAAWIRQHRRSA